jgi:glycerol kinase
MSKYILAIDQGTTSCRAILYDLKLNKISSSQKEFKQYFPQEGWVEHNANEIWFTQLSCCKAAMQEAKALGTDIACIGITNQRETIVAWDKSTGKPIYNAIVWQDRRTAADCINDEKIIGPVNGFKTGLPIDPYFSSSKIRWIINNVDKAKTLIASNNLCVGTIDSWLIWKLTNGEVFATDSSNASRTNLYNIQTLDWDEELLTYYQIPRSVLPLVINSIGNYGEVNAEYFGQKIKILSVAGDQQASLYGHQCWEAGMVKSTMGTGCFLLKNIGHRYLNPEQGLLTTIAWTENGQPTYATEGSIFHAGSALKWLKENLNLIQSYDEIETIFKNQDSNDAILMVPAFTGLGAPHWDIFARGIMVGLTRNTSRADIIRATIESIGFQTKDIVTAMDKNTPAKLVELSVDGGVSNSEYICQFIADILQVKINRPTSSECTALGVAMMAAKAFEIEISIEKNKFGDAFYPQISIENATQKYATWLKAIERAKGWAEK